MQESRTKGKEEDLSRERDEGDAGESKNHKMHVKITWGSPLLLKLIFKIFKENKYP